MQNKITKIYTSIVTFKINNYALIATEIIAIALAFYLLAVVNETNSKELWEFGPADIHYEFWQAEALTKGENIYKPILNQDLLTNNKYATLLPLYYYFLGGLVLITDYDWGAFINLLTTTLFIAEMAAGFFIYMLFRREGKRLLGYLAMTFFMFNRWTIHNVAGNKQDIIAIALLMLSFYLFYSKNKKQKVWSYFLFGLSLGIKHLSIFLFPIYLMPLFTGELSLKQFMKGIVLFLIPSFGVGLFLIIDSPTAFFYSMLFSFTRESNKINLNFGYENLLVLYNVGVEKNNIRYYLLPRLPLVLFSLMNLILMFLKHIPPSLYCLSAMFIFIAFNPVLFSQYFTWIPPLLFMSAIEYLRATNKSVYTSLPEA